VDKLFQFLGSNKDGAICFNGSNFRIEFRQESLNISNLLSERNIHEAFQSFEKVVSYNEHENENISLEDFEKVVRMTVSDKVRKLFKGSD
jgi:hypothetical protein